MTPKAPWALIVRHPKERLSKCSLEPLRHHPALHFIKAREGLRLDASGHLLLTLEAPVLSAADAGLPLLLLDSTWRLLPQLRRCLDGTPLLRSLPPVQTAYPRTSKIAEDPQAGLASVEALYLALRLTGRDCPELLAHYRWREAFLQHLAAAGC